MRAPGADISKTGIPLNYTPAPTLSLDTARGESFPRAAQVAIGRHQIDYHWLFNNGSQILSSRRKDLLTGPGGLAAAP